MKQIKMYLVALFVMALIFSSCTTEEFYECGEESAVPVADFEIELANEFYSMYDFEAEFSPNLFYRWEVILKPDTIVVQDWTQGGRFIDNYEFKKGGMYEVKLTVANEDNVKASVSHKLEVQIKLTDELIDNDGQVYPTKRFGEDVWTTANWNRPTSTSLYYENDSLANHGDGRLYSHADAVANCPEGWRVATDADFRRLLYILDGDDFSTDKTAVKLQATSSRWTIPGTNESGFSALPSGVCGVGGETPQFEGIDQYAYFVTESAAWIIIGATQEFENQNLIDYQGITVLTGVRFVKIRE